MSNRPDFVIALVGAVGSPLRETYEELASKIEGYGYRIHRIHLSDAFPHLTSDLGEKVRQALSSDENCYRDIHGEYERIRKAMATGTVARESFAGVEKDTKNTCLAELAIQAISSLRAQASASRCIIVHSLKTPEELYRLREVYGSRLLVVGLHTPKSERYARLVERIQRNTGRSAVAEECAVRLIGIDERERGTDYGQNMEKVFEKCDVYISASSRDSKLRDQTDRLARLLFLHTFETPTAEENAMVHAFVSSLRSSSMARQVGAAITTKDGDLVAAGFNEIPLFGGVPCGSDRAVDGRDCARGEDENAVQKRVLVEQLLRLASEDGLLKSEVVVEDAARRISGSSRAKDLLATNITEFGRDVHAEMAAITSAAKRGVALRGCIIYSTTFPCHNCAKHILASGISEVVFIEAYAKSFAESFYRDSLAIDRSDHGKLLVRSFMGVAPRFYQAIFAWRERRKKDGSALMPDSQSAVPWFTLESHLTDDELARREKGSVDVSGGRLKEIFDMSKAKKALIEPQKTEDESVGKSEVGPGIRDADPERYRSVELPVSASKPAQHR